MPRELITFFGVGVDHWAAVDTVKRDCVHPMPLPPGLWSSLDLSKHSSRNSLTADAIRHGSRTKSSLQLVACVAPHYTSNHESIVRELTRRKLPSDAPFCGIGGAEPRSGATFVPTVWVGSCSCYCLVTIFICCTEYGNSRPQSIQHTYARPTRSRCGRYAGAHSRIGTPRSTSAGS